MTEMDLLKEALKLDEIDTEAIREKCFSECEIRLAREAQRAQRTKSIIISLCIRVIPVLLVIITVVTFPYIQAIADRNETAEFGFDSDKNGDMLEISSTGEIICPDTIEKEYTVEVPKEFKKVHSEKDEYIVHTLWESDKASLEFYQTVVSVRGYFTDGVPNLDEFTQEGIEFIFFELDGKNTLMWNDYGYSFLLVSKEYDKNELTEIALTL